MAATEHVRGKLSQPPLSQLPVTSTNHESGDSETGRLRIPMGRFDMPGHAQFFQIEKYQLLLSHKSEMYQDNAVREGDSDSCTRQGDPSPLWLAGRLFGVSVST